MEFFTSKDWLNRGLNSYAFQWDHLLFIFIILGIGVFLSILLRKKDKSIVKKVLIILWAIGVTLETTYYIWTYVMCGMNPTNNPFKLDSHLPLHSCLMFFYLFPFAIFSNNKVIKLATSNFLVVVNMIMGFITLFVGCPSSGYSALSFDGVQILTYHGIIVIVPLIMVVTNYYDIQKNDWKYGLSLFGILSVFIWTFDAIFGCDYFFFYDGHRFPAFKFISENVHHLVWTLIVVSCYVITAFATHFLIVGIKHLIHEKQTNKEIE
ncbi:MAG: YwaF family protein [Bacilli bacterium]|nr:YwaF family protein [Bacilli bacterium]